jgi:hypothetical protein
MAASTGSTAPVTIRLGKVWVALMGTILARRRPKVGKHHGALQDNTRAISPARLALVDRSCSNPLNLVHGRGVCRRGN